MKEYTASYYLRSTFPKKITVKAHNMLLAVIECILQLGRDAVIISIEELPDIIE